MNKKIFFSLMMLSVKFAFAEESVVKPMATEAAVSEIATEVIVTETKVQPESDKKAELEQSNVEMIVKKPSKLEDAKAEAQVEKAASDDIVVCEEAFDDEDFDEEAFAKELESLLAQMQLPEATK